ncbi:hypothetical protein [Streptomyces sp. NPDC050355]|uniref:hypothetical protein n=1 Tax=Streptomyces sp. NPDC050355 TaxID=3365609 RepID=UPI0037B0DE14
MATGPRPERAAADLSPGPPPPRRRRALTPSRALAPALALALLLAALLSAGIGAYEVPVGGVVDTTWGRPRRTRTGRRCCTTD